MPGPNAPYTALDYSQVLRQAFDESQDRIRVEGSISVNLDAFTKIPPDNVLVVGSEDGTTTGVKHVLKVDSSGQLYTISSNPSIGLTGSTAPLSATLVGFADPSGNLASAKVNAAHALTVDGSAVTQPISAAALPLPAGAATSSLQTTGNTSLATIITDLTNGTQVTQITGTVPLPTGAATSSLQTTGNTSLNSIDTKTPALGQALAAASVPVVLTASQLTTLTPLSTVTVTQATGTNLHTVVDSSALPSGASTSALQTTGNTSLSSIVTNTTGLATASAQTTGNSSLATIATNTTGVSTASNQTTGNTSLASIDSKTPALGQQLAAASQPVVLTAAQLTTLTPLTSVTVTQATGTNLHTVVDSSALPAGAATSALQTTGNTSLATIATNTANAGTPVIKGTAFANAPFYNSGYTGSPITTSAYVQLIASTTNATNSVHIFDSSGQAMILAVGGVGSEVDQYIVQPGGDTFGLAIPAGSRVSYKAKTASATSGYLIMNLLQ